MRKKLSALIALGAFCLAYAGTTFAQTWSLSNEQRRAYLYYYAPVIFKRANENNGYTGWDWITNFNFDGTPTFNDNKLNWKKVAGYTAVNPQPFYSGWSIRPTLYTAAIEFMDQGSKELVLLYHVYHALDQNAADKFGVHDWERVEIHLKGLVGSPGSGEIVNHAVVTQHHRSIVRTGAEAQFLPTATGKHLMVWQAEWSGHLTPGKPHGQELRFVQDTWTYTASRLAQNKQSEVDVNGEDGRKNVHYVFVPVGSASAVSTFSAQTITRTNARFLASGRDNETTVQWNDAKRVTYELQDLADIMSTHSPTSYHTAPGILQSWRNDVTTRVTMLDPILNEAGTFVEMPVVIGPDGQPTALVLNAGSADVEEENYNDEREGYPDKSFWWGCYNMNNSVGLTGPGSFCGESLSSSITDWRGRTRTGANGKPATAISPASWVQHDYFVHFGYTDNTDHGDPGFWLPGEWYKPENGGFDGRWVQLFSDY